MSETIQNLSTDNVISETEISLAVEKNKAPQPYWNPYIAGLGLGLVLLFAYVIMGRGLGASGAINTLISVGMDNIAHQHAQSNLVYQGYLGDGTYNPLKDWLVFEVLGVIAGGFISGVFAHRIKFTTEKGPKTTNKQRWLFALIGGAMMGVGAKLAGGCTSGQALSGGSVLNVGSWAFMLCVFAGAYLLAYFVRRLWI